MSQRGVTRIAIVSEPLDLGVRRDSRILLICLQYVIIGGHEDSVGSSATGRSPGADDDGTGTVTVLEIFRVLVENNFYPDRTLQFITYAGMQGYAHELFSLDQPFGYGVKASEDLGNDLGYRINFRNSWSFTELSPEEAGFSGASIPVIVTSLLFGEFQLKMPAIVQIIFVTTIY